MKKYYYLITIFSILLIGIGIYYLSVLDFGSSNNSFNREEKDIDTLQYITFGEFLKSVIEKSLDNVDYELINTKISHNAAPYLTVAENYDVVEKNTITAEKLDEPISKLEALKICALCDINIRHHTLKQDKDDKIEQMNTLSDLEKSLLEHLSVNDAMRDMISNEDIMNQTYITTDDAHNLLSIYLNIE